MTPEAASCGDCSLVGDHARYFMLIRLIDHRIGVELAFALRTLGSQDVALKRVSALDFACTCLLETLGRSLMCLQLRHSGLSILQHHRSRNADQPATPVCAESIAH